MSENTPAESAWSAFATFEMPTSEVVFGFPQEDLSEPVAAEFATPDAPAAGPEVEEVAAKTGPEATTPQEVATSQEVAADNVTGDGDGIEDGEEFLRTNSVAQDIRPESAVNEVAFVNSAQPTAVDVSAVVEASVDAHATEPALHKAESSALPSASSEQRDDPLPTSQQTEVSSKRTESPCAANSVDTLFRDLPLLAEVKRSIQRSGYEKPTGIQAQIIPHMLEGRDVLAQSQTGTGKTAAFALPILSRLDIKNRTPQILVLTPTRELAIQVGKSFSTYGADLPGLNIATIYGGSDYDPQLRQLRRGAQIVVGTPGRTIDHIKRGTLKLDGITCLTLDEADEMLNMGFLEDVEFVLEHTPNDRQIALFSATMPAPIRNIAKRYLNDPARITIKTRTMTADSIRQRALFIPPRDKIDVLSRFLEVEDTDGVIVFTKTREATVSVAESLSQQGLSAVALNGDIPQKLRERTIEQLKSGKLDILVATDVAARGLDVTRISHVFNFDVPNDSESYVHRIGRTGRAGRKGEAIIFLSNSQRYKLRSIERATKQPIEVVQPPTAADMNAMRVLRFKQKITEVMSEQDLAMFHQLITEYAEESGKPMAYIAAALAHIGQGGRPFFAEDRRRRKQFDREERNARSQERGRHDRGNSGRYERNSAGRDDRRGGSPRQVGPPRPGMDRYRIEVGSKDGVKPGNIVGAVANEGGIDGDQIGPISIHDTHSTVDLPTGMPDDIFRTLQQTWVAGKQLKLSRDLGRRMGSGSRSGGGRNVRSGAHGSGKKTFSKRNGPGAGKFKKCKPKTR